jgi:RNA polymerase sigma-70 factor, ECF subfamily
MAVSRASLRSNDDWVFLLTSAPPACNPAIGDLQTYLQRGLLKALNGYPHFNREAAEDFVQEATVKIIEKIDTFGGRARFTTWAMKIAVNLSITELRKKQWQQISLDSLEYPDELLSRANLVRNFESPERKTLKTEAVDLINRLIREDLPKKQAKVLTAAFLHGLPLTEIARQMDTNKNAIYKLIHDARLYLKKRLQKEGFSVQEILESI